MDTKTAAALIGFVARQVPTDADLEVLIVGLNLPYVQPFGLLRDAGFLLPRLPLSPPTHTNP